MTDLGYTPHFVVVGGPGPHPSGDGRMGVCLIASKSLKKVEIEKEIKGSTYWDLFPPVHKYVTTIMVTLDSREGHQYHIIWAYDYPEAWKSLFEVWGDNIVPDNQRLLEHDSDRRALRR